MQQVDETLPADAEEGGGALSGDSAGPESASESGEAQGDTSGANDGASAAAAGDSQADTDAPDAPKFLVPAEWAKALGHCDPVVALGGRCNASDCRAWIYAAAKVHAGWGVLLPDDLLLSREEYEAAVDSALNRPLGEVRTHQMLARIAEQTKQAKASQQEAS